MTLLRIRSARPLSGTWLRLTLSDGREVDRDLADLCAGPALESLGRDADLFRKVAVEEGALTWPNGADLCPDVVIWGGPPPAGGDAAPPDRLRPSLPRD
jgi:hypothetical protein